VSGATSRRKGNRAEVEVVAALKRAGWAAVTSRNARDGTQGGADVITDFPMVIEVKSVARMDLSGWWRQAQDQAGEDELPVVIHKRVGHSKAEDWWVCMDMHTLLRLVERLDDGRT
jgi:hypothetical protein